MISMVIMGFFPIENLQFFTLWPYTMSASMDGHLSKDSPHRVFPISYHFCLGPASHLNEVSPGEPDFLLLPTTVKPYPQVNLISDFVLELLANNMKWTSFSYFWQPLWTKRTWFPTFAYRCELISVPRDTRDLANKPTPSTNWILRCEVNLISHFWKPLWSEPHFLSIP